MSPRFSGRILAALALPAAAAGAMWWLKRSQRQQSRPKPAPAPDFIGFPEDFVWGAATSSYQVEGGIVNDWSAAGFDAGICMDHLHRYPEDFDHAREMGHNAHRFSLEWARIEPEQGKFNAEAIGHYRQVLLSLKARGLTPFVTLWHFTLPIWFAAKGGWTKEENIADFVSYVEHVMRELGDLAEFWITINEPLVYTFQSYDEGRWPPFAHDRNQALLVARHLVLAHARAWRAMHAIRPDIKVGLVKNMTVMDPLQDWHPLSVALTRIQDQLYNEAIWIALSTGELELRLPGCRPIRIEAHEDVKGAIDFIGINYYTRYLVGPTAALMTRKGAPVTDLGWEIYPEGLTRVLQQAAPYAQALNVPIYITENGLADARDAQRKAYLVHHLHAVWAAIAAGVPVKGYFHWSLLDNFEWADGFGYQFGLLDAERNWRPAARLYQRIIQDRGFAAGLLQQHVFSPPLHAAESDVLRA